MCQNVTTDNPNNFRPKSHTDTGTSSADINRIVNYRTGFGPPKGPPPSPQPSYIVLAALLVYSAYGIRINFGEQRENPKKHVKRHNQNVKWLMPQRYYLPLRRSRRNQKGRGKRTTERDLGGSNPILLDMLVGQFHQVTQFLEDNLSQANGNGLIYFVSPGKCLERTRVENPRLRVRYSFILGLRRCPAGGIMIFDNLFGGAWISASPKAVTRLVLCSITPYGLCHQPNTLVQRLHTLSAAQPTLFIPDLRRLRYAHLVFKRALKECKALSKKIQDCLDLKLRLAQSASSACAMGYLSKNLSPFRRRQHEPLCVISSIELASWPLENL
ncbi:hypothetical protein K438DRAFT_1936026 [Mycena galopus ATCC 62051]|nr:hypothetical protein K438DRAFT_1936026 [Mycena galopus ATCC 62051]